MGVIKTKIRINPEAIGAKIEDLVNDPQTMLEVHNLYAKMMEPYVPFEAGLSNLEVTPESVHYNVPYAHYHYIGDTYGLNIPIVKNGIIIGWFSKPDEDGRKHPTGGRLQYSKPRASDHWDQAMLADKKEEFIQQVGEILARRAKELYG